MFRAARRSRPAALMPHRCLQAESWDGLTVGPPTSPTLASCDTNTSSPRGTARPFQIRIVPSLAVVTFGVCVIAPFFAGAALADPLDVRWSANRAAIVAALFYAVAIPLMLRPPIDGDEPYYLLETESIVHDRD